MAEPDPEPPIAPGSRRWTPASAARRAVAVARAEGLGSLWTRALGETFYRRLILLERPLETEPEVRDARVKLDFGFAEDVEKLAAARSWPGAAEIRRRLDSGERCYCARHDGQVVATRWVATGSVRIPYLARSLDLADGDVFVYEAYTAPEFRRLGITQAVESRLGVLLHEEGHHRILRTVLPENAPGVGMHAALGNRPIGTIGYVGIGPWRHDFVRLGGVRLPR